MSPAIVCLTHRVLSKHLTDDGWQMRIRDTGCRIYLIKNSYHFDNRRPLRGGLCKYFLGSRNRGVALPGNYFSSAQIQDVTCYSIKHEKLRPTKLQICCRKASYLCPKHLLSCLCLILVEVMMMYLRSGESWDQDLAHFAQGLIRVAGGDSYLSQDVIIHSYCCQIVNVVQ